MADRAGVTGGFCAQRSVTDCDSTMHAIDQKPLAQVLTCCTAVHSLLPAAVKLMAQQQAVRDTPAGPGCSKRNPSSKELLQSYLDRDAVVQS